MSDKQFYPILLSSIFCCLIKFLRLRKDGKVWGWFVLLIMLFLMTSCTSTTSLNNNAANINLSIAMQYLQKNMLLNAKQHFLLALQQAPHDPLVLSGYGFYLQTVNDAKAAAIFQQALRLAHDQPQVFNNIAVFYCQQHHYIQAMQLFNKALQMPNYLFSAQLYENMGICTYKKFGCRRALPYFVAALHRDAHLLFSRQQLTLCLDKKP